MPVPPVPTPREDVTETLHGELVHDPYRWLENAADPRVQAWIGEQNRLLERTLAPIAERATVRERIARLLEIGSVSLPTVTRGGAGFRYFYTRREGTQNQPVLYVRDGAHGAERVLFDANALSAQGSVALDWYQPSLDGSLLAYGSSEDGSEESTLRVRDVTSGRDLDDVIPHTRHASIAWLPGSKRFFYTRYPKPGSVPEGEERYHRKVYEHVLGADPAGDRLIFGDLSLTDFPSVSVSPNGRHVFVHVHQGWTKTELYYAELGSSAPVFEKLTDGKDQRYSALILDDAFYVLTNEGAPRGAIYRATFNRPRREHWQLLIPEHGEDVLTGFDVVRGKLFVSYMHQAASRLEIFDASGKSLGPVELPALGASNGFSGHHQGDEVFFSFESFAIPPSIRRLDLATGKTEAWATVKSDLRPEDYRVTRGEARSKDGTRVPYMMVHGAGLSLESGDNPTLLYGYGGFNISLEPRFSRASYALLERGGVFVQANLRGGGEFGESWHRLGQLEHKQNTFDDFVAVAEDLIRRGVTRRERLAIYGRSNGGLLVAAALTQRPDLFRAAVSSVPLTDMLRYERFSIAKLWIPEYGSAEDPEQFGFLRAYSPYHRVTPGVAYPAVLLTTAESDTRVDPLHARKLAAALQYSSSSDLPVLLRTETEAGHGAGTPLHKLVGELSDVYTFVLWQLGVLERAKNAETAGVEPASGLQ